VGDERDEHGNVVPRTIPVRFHFLIVKDGNVVSGEANATGNAWQGAANAEGLTPGPALAVGLAIQVKATPAPTFETATWAEQIMLT
jgi:hypothetical protein